MGSSLLPRRSSALDVECPVGYRFYACAVSSFTGCCSTDPCRLSNACPLENRPASSTSSSAPVVTAEPTPKPFSTNAASFTNLSTSRTVTIVIPTTHLPSPTTTTATISTIFSLPPSSSPSSSPGTSSSSSPKQFNPVGLIVGLTVGFTVLALMLALVIYLLWRRRQTRDLCDEEPILPMRSLRATAFYLPQKQPFNSPTMTSPNTDKPVPPAPTWRESFAEAGLSDQQAVRDNRPSPRYISIKAAGPASTTTNEAAPAPTVWRRRSDAPREPAPAAAGAHGAAQQPMSRSTSPVDSIFDVPQRRTTAELDASWAFFREGPAAFHGLSAPPRSRDGSRPGSNSNQGG